MQSATQSAHESFGNQPAIKRAFLRSITLSPNSKPSYIIPELVRELYLGTDSIAKHALFTARKEFYMWYKVDYRKNSPKHVLLFGLLAAYLNYDPKFAGQHKKFMPKHEYQGHEARETWGRVTKTDKNEYSVTVFAANGYNMQTRAKTARDGYQEIERFKRVLNRTTLDARKPIYIAHPAGHSTLFIRRMEALGVAKV